MQGVYFDYEGKLQIVTDNGSISDNGATTKTKIEGTFTIDAEDVAKLLTMMSGKVTCARETYYWGQKHAFYLATDKDFEEAAEHQKYIEKELDIQRDRVKRLTRKIEEHNDNCGFFGRKIKIEDNNDSIGK